MKRVGSIFIARRVCLGIYGNRGMFFYNQNWDVENMVLHVIGSIKWLFWPTYAFTK